MVQMQHKILVHQLQDGQIFTLCDLQLSNEGSANDVDGTWGQYTIQEVRMISSF